MESLSNIHRNYAKQVQVPLHLHERSVLEDVDNKNNVNQTIHIHTHTLLYIYVQIGMYTIYWLIDRVSSSLYTDDKCLLNDMVW